MQTPETPQAPQAAPAPAQTPAPIPGTPAPVSVETQEGARAITIQLPGAEQAMSQEQVSALERRRDELGDQLQSVQDRRSEVASSLHGADPSARVGIEQRLRVLDERIVQLESDLGATSSQLASVPAALALAERPPRPASSGNDEEEFLFIGLFLGVATTWVAGRIRRWRRQRRQGSAALPASQPDQLMRLEQAIDAIAIEVERIAEGQRFTAKLMAESAERPRRETVPREGANGF